MTGGHGSPVVSVIMSMCDSAPTIVPSVRSLVFQNLREWELILIDDGSKDDGAARVAALSDPRIRIVVHKERRGLPSRLNEAVNLASGEFIARMDADDICYPERLDAQVALLRSDSSLDLVACKALVFKGDGDPVGIFPVEADHARITASPMSGFYFPHPTWCGKAEWFRRHRYNERMLKAQDQELLLRTAATSRFSAVDAVLLGYRQERLELLKSIRGRAQFSGALWREGRRIGQRARAVKAILMQGAKLATEAVVIGLGLQDLLINRKFKPLPNDELARWRTIWNSVNGDAKLRG